MLVGSEAFIDIINQALESEDLSEKDRAMANKAIEALKEIDEESDEPEDFQTTMARLHSIMEEFKGEQDGNAGQH